MPTPIDLADWLANHFATHQQHTADVLAGPKRETWFSSEAFVALSKAAPPDSLNPLLPSFSCWGEEGYTTILNKVDASAAIGGQPRRRPDVVCYLPRTSLSAIDAILELKLVLNDEVADNGLEDLKTQLENATTMAPGAKALGVVFLAAAPLKTPGTFDTSVRKLRADIERIMPNNKGYSWVPGHDVVPVFRSVPTSYLYPSMSVSLALGVRQYTPPASQTASAAPASTPSPPPADHAR